MMPAFLKFDLVVYENECPFKGTVMIVHCNDSYFYVGITNSL
jgi:hypothetical protein